jgi:hypothetical protein
MCGFFAVQGVTGQASGDEQLQCDEYNILILVDSVET